MGIYPYKTTVVFLLSSTLAIQCLAGGTKSDAALEGLHGDDSGKCSTSLKLTEESDELSLLTISTRLSPGPEHEKTNAFRKAMAALAKAELKNQHWTQSKLAARRKEIAAQVAEEKAAKAAKVAVTDTQEEAAKTSEAVSEAAYGVGAAASSDCPDGFKAISDKATCKAAAKLMSLEWHGEGHWPKTQSGCIEQFEKGKVWYNGDGSGPAGRQFKPVCAKDGSDAAWPTHDNAELGAFHNEGLQVNVASNEASRPRTVDNSFTHPMQAASPHQDGVIDENDVEVSSRWASDASQPDEHGPAAEAEDTEISSREHGKHPRLSEQE